MNIKRIWCYIKAIPFWVRMRFNKDFFIPHVFVEEEWITPVFVNKKTNKIRIADTYAHEIDEEFIPNAIFIGCTCKYCGYKTARFKRIGECTEVDEKQMSILYYERKYGE